MYWYQTPTMLQRPTVSDLVGNYMMHLKSRVQYGYSVWSTNKVTVLIVDQH